MTAIVSPKPRHAFRRHPQPPIPAQLSPPIYMANDLPRRLASTSMSLPPRLMSPIHLADSKSYLSKVSSPCSPSKRRRGHTIASGRPARRRHCARSDCSITYTGGPSVFDKLSWISQVEEPQTAEIWDIADLSLLPIEHPARCPSSGIGPVRRRKLSPRSDPMSASSPSSLEDIAATRTRRSTALLPLIDREVLDPHTPPPRESFNLDEARFFNLMPALPVDVLNDWSD